MATWIKALDGSTYYHTNNLLSVTVQQNIPPSNGPGNGDNQWYITGVFNSTISVVWIRGPYATQAAAQTALDSAVTNLGGNV